MSFPTTASYPAAAAYPAAASFPAVASFPSNYDPEAVAYFAASGVTDPGQRLNISQFFTGIRGLNLWTAFYEGWSFRSTQNIGSGTSAVGLKGRFTGTLTNAPTWGTGGITFGTGASRYVAASILLYDAKVNTDMAFFNASNIATTAIATYGTGAAADLYIERSSTSSLAAIALGVGGGTLAATTAAAYQIGFSYPVGMVQASVKLAINGGAFTTTTPFGGDTNLTNGSLRIGVLAGGNSVGSTQSAYLKFSRILTTTEHAAVYALYKVTIGQGLGLP